MLTIVGLGRDQPCVIAYSSLDERLYQLSNQPDGLARSVLPGDPTRDHAGAV